MDYSEAISVLERAKEKFEFPVKWGMDLQSEHERYLTEKHVKRPVIVLNYPKDIKAFYMRVNDDGRTVAAMDVLAPGIGEIIGGSQREERLDVLDAAASTRSTTLGIAICVGTAPFRMPGSALDSSVLSPTSPVFQTCGMLSHFHERQEIRDTESTLRTPSLQCRPTAMSTCR
jgi:tRNA synthetases class II (D, K and N)